MITIANNNVDDIGKKVHAYNLPISSNSSKAGQNERNKVSPGVLDSGDQMLEFLLALFFPPIRKSTILMLN